MSAIREQDISPRFPTAATITLAKANVHHAFAIMKLWLLAMILAAATPFLVCAVQGEETGGQLEPYAKMEIASPEPGIVKTILVREGDLVTQDQVVVEMDDSVLQASLAVADQARRSRGNIDSAQADLRIRESLYARLEPLIGRGSATREEFDRALSEVELAKARVVAAQEELQIRELEYQRIAVEIERRKLRSHISGIVVKVDRHAGEYVSPSNPVVLKIVQLDTLKAVLLIPRSYAQTLKPQQNIEIVVGFAALPVTGTIDYISPLTQPGGSDVELKVRIDNAEGKFQAGDRCSLASAVALENPERPRLQLRQLPRP